MSSILPGQFAAHYLFAETVIQDSSDCANGGSCVDQKCTIHEFMSVIEEYQVNSNDPNIADPNPVKTVLKNSQPGGNHKAGNVTFLR